MKFLALNAYFYSKFRPPIGSRSPPYGGVKFGYYYYWQFTAVARLMHISSDFLLYTGLSQISRFMRNWCWHFMVEMSRSWGHTWNDPVQTKCKILRMKMPHRMLTVAPVRSRVSFLFSSCLCRLRSVIVNVLIAFSWIGLSLFDVRLTVKHCWR